jgi:Domain of unknown function (DUF6471)
MLRLMNIQVSDADSLVDSAKCAIRELQTDSPEVWLEAESDGLKDTEAGITMKLKRGTFTARFFLACVAALELEQVVLDEI